jgi:PIN domain nuclease of toxin-antitoxin system
VKTGSEFVLDASALLALMRAERGADRVAAVIDRAVIGAVNLAEVVSKFVREEIAIGVVREWLAGLELEVRPFDRELAYAAGMLVPTTRRRGLSLGDRACLALARELGRTALTTDRAWRDLDVGVEIEVIR